MVPMLRRLLVSTLAATLFLAPPALGAETTDIAARAEAVIQRLAPPESHVGVSVLVLGTGQALYEHEADKLFTPASLQKLATASAVLSLLGTQRRFTTRLLAGGPVENGVLKGHLYLRGEGDPTLEAADLEEMATKLRAQGVKRVAGDLVADATYFQPEGRGAPGWAWDDLAQGYGAPVSALSLHRNTIDVRIWPGAHANEPVRVEVTPGTAYMALQIKASTQSTGSESNLGLDVTPATGGVWQEVLSARGGLPLGAGQTIEHLSVAEPVHYTVSFMKEALNRAGIAVDGQVREGVTPGSARAVEAHLSPFLADIVRDMLKESDNLLAETMLLQLGAHAKGAPGTWEKGLATLGTFLETAGWTHDAYKLSDGSGLSRYDQVSPAMLAKLLTYMPSQPVGYPGLLIALPVAGIDGTLATRLNTPVTRGHMRAKTGTMSGVSGLAGYLETADGKSLVVVIMTNGFVGSAARSRQLQDALVEMLAEPDKTEKSGS
jgi:D-alanyl-D-alanine carboxypeptidase/D-alanyl-D-alanine-endopeptidase (penicillin-binding protein 4)